eukprot:1196235-Prorocentrum_minimum.AAC.5
MVKHRRWGGDANNGGSGSVDYVDDHLVLVSLGVALYNTAVPWVQRRTGTSPHGPGGIRGDLAPSTAHAGGGGACCCFR